MRKIDKYVFKTYIGPFFMTFLVVVFIFLMQFVWKYIDDLVGKGLAFAILIKLMGYTSCTFIPMALPLALLLSGLITFGNMGEHSELTAMKSSGIPLYRIMRPLVIFAVLCSIGSFFLANNLVPYANLKGTILLKDIRSQKPALNIDEKVFYKDIDNYVIRIGEKEKDNQTIHDILIYDHSNNSNYACVVHAEKGKMIVDEEKQYLIFTLENGFIYNENLENEDYRPEDLSVMRGYFDKRQMRFDLSSFNLNHSSEDSYRTNYKVLNVKQLTYFIDSIREDLKENRSGMGDIISGNFRCVKKYCADTLTYKTDNSLFSYNFSKNEKFEKVLHALNLAREHKSVLNFFSLDCENRESQLWRYEIEWHRKYTLCAACIILFFIGAPLGSIIRKGGIGIPLTISIFIFVIYWVISTIGERMARMGNLSSAWGMWISTLVFLPVGLFLIYKSTRENHWNNLSLIDKIKKISSKKRNENSSVMQ